MIGNDLQENIIHCFFHAQHNLENFAFHFGPKLRISNVYSQHLLDLIFVKMRELITILVQLCFLHFL